MALERTVTLVKTNQAQLTVVEVIEKLSRGAYMLITAMTPQELQTLVVKDQQEQLQHLISPIKQEVDRVLSKC